MGQITSVPAPALHSTNATVPRFQPQVDSWVQLRDLPSPYSYDRALLVCELDHDHWVAWVPDHGEMMLHRSQFHRPES